MRGSANPAVFATGLVIVAALMGILLVQDPGIAIPFTLEAIVLLILTIVLVGRERDPASRRWLTRLVIAMLAFRFGLAVFVHFNTVMPAAFFAPDALGYGRAGDDLAAFWSGSGPDPTYIEAGWRQGYYYLNGFFAYLMEESVLGLVVLNIFAGVWTAILSFYLAREIIDVRAAKVTAVLTGFFPSLVLWSILNIRDAMATFFVMLIVYASTRLAARIRPTHLLMMGIGLLGLSSLRDYMGFLVLAGILLGVFVAVRPERIAANLVLGTVAVVFLTYVAERVDLFSTVTPENALETAQLLRTGLQADATSAFGVGATTETIGGALQYLPLGASYLLFAPFPWAIDTPLQLVATPETLLWYPLFFFALRGMFLVYRYGDGASMMLPVAVLLVTTASYALVEGNFGTAYRHRAQIMPLFFIFTGVGILWFYDRIWRQTPWSRTRRRSAGPPTRPPATVDG